MSVVNALLCILVSAYLCLVVAQFHTPVWN